MEVAANSALCAKGLVRRYRDDISKTAQAALAGIDLNLKPQEALMLIGLNGAGKSTLLRLAAGVEVPSDGQIEIFGASPRSAANRRRVGYLPDGAELFPFLNVEETLQFFASCAGLDRPTQRREIARLVERFGMQGYVKKRAAHHSTGMRRRLALAAVLIGKPDLLLLDEPASGLDPEASRLFLEILREEKARGVAIMMASHHLAHAEVLCDRVVILAQGKISFDGDLSALAERIGQHDVSVTRSADVSSADLKARLQAAGVDPQSWRVSERALEDFLITESRK